MKKHVMLLWGLVMSMMAFGQNQTQIALDEMSITPPEFIESEITLQGLDIESINDYLGRFVEYPEGTSVHHMIGTEIVQFEVSPSGELSNFHVINSISSEIDADVIRVLRTTNGMWKPGLVNEQPVPMKKEISVVFKPHDNYNLTMAAKAYQNRGNQILHSKDNPKKAMIYFNKAIKLRPYEESILAARSLCKYEMGDEKGAIEDYNRILVLKNSDSVDPEAEYSAKVLNQVQEYAELSLLDE